MIAALALAAACSWNHPGADPTTSAVPATLAAMGINSPALAAKIVAGDYSELVTIHRGDQRPYGMTSGNARYCAGPVDTGQWAEDQAEQGRVFRVGSLAVVWFWRCHNMSVWTVPDEAGAPPAIADEPSATPAEPLPLYEIPALAPTGAGIATDAAATPEGSGGYAPSFIGAGGVAFGSTSAPCACCELSAQPVPEPAAWTLLAAGLSALIFRRRGANHKGAKS